MLIVPFGHLHQKLIYMFLIDVKVTSNILFAVYFLSVSTIEHLTYSRTCSVNCLTTNIPWNTVLNTISPISSLSFTLIIYFLLKQVCISVIFYLTYFVQVKQSSNDNFTAYRKTVGKLFHIFL